MNLRDLKAIEASSSPAPWSYFYKSKYDEWHVGAAQAVGGMKIALFQDGCPTECAESDTALIATLRNLAPDLLALWEAVNSVHLGPCPNPNEMRDVQAIEDAIKNLNAKAAALR